MQLYHTTFVADAIIAEGFKDAEGYYLTHQLWRRVWLASRPLDANEGAYGGAVLVLDIPEEVIAPYEWVNEWPEGHETSDLAYREFLVPAAVVNRYGPPRKMEEAPSPPH